MNVKFARYIVFITLKINNYRQNSDAAILDFENFVNKTMIRWNVLFIIITMMRYFNIILLSFYAIWSMLNFFGTKLLINTFIVFFGNWCIPLWHHDYADKMHILSNQIGSVSNRFRFQTDHILSKTSP